MSKISSWGADRRRRVSLKNFGPNPTKQADGPLTDVDRIYSRFKETGLWSHVAARPPSSGDFSQFTSYHDSLNLVLAAEQQFEALPSQVRAAFRNDPAQLIAFVDNPANASKLAEFGLLDGRAVPPASRPDAGASAPQNAGDAPASTPSEKG